SGPWNPNLCAMGLPNGPVTLSVQQLEELNKKLSTLRHDVNNHLSLVVAAAELIKFNPQMAARMSATLSEQPPKISEEINRFSVELERALGITR
ncbi:MAG: hypothetical protein DME25_14395, partial [Verrucomicrobia bacterium]